MALRSVRERVWQALAFEAGGLLIVTPMYGAIMAVGMRESAALVAAVAMVAMLWSPVHNSGFDWAEWQLAQRVASNRPAHLRLIHAISHELTTTLVTLPVIMLVGRYGFSKALGIDIALSFFYAAYAYVFHWCYDRWRPIRRAENDGGSGEAAQPMETSVVGARS